MKKKKDFPYPLLTPLYEIEAFLLNNKTNSFVQNCYTDAMYVNFDDAVEAARKTAFRIAWHNNMPDVERSDVFLVHVLYGRKFSKQKVIYGFPKVVYGVSSGNKEMTDACPVDPKLKVVRIDEYTEQPHLTRDMFYQWED